MAPKDQQQNQKNLPNTKERKLNSNYQRLAAAEAEEGAGAAAVFV